MKYIEQATPDELQRLDAIARIAKDNSAERRKIFDRWRKRAQRARNDATNIARA